MSRLTPGCFGGLPVDASAPVILTPSDINAPENAPLAVPLSANKPVTWDKTGGIDGAHFEIVAGVLRWTGDGVKDFETRGDANADGTYSVTVRATSTENGLQTSQSIRVAVTNVFEQPALSALALSTSSVPEQQAATINITGATAGSVLSIVGTLPAGMALNSAARTITGTPPNPSFGTYNFSLVETLGDSPNSPRTTAVTLNVTLEAPLITSAVLSPDPVVSGSPMTCTISTAGGPADGPPTYSWFIHDGVNTDTQVPTADDTSNTFTPTEAQGFKTGDQVGCYVYVANRADSSDTYVLAGFTSTAAAFNPESGLGTPTTYAANTTFTTTAGNRLNNVVFAMDVDPTSGQGVLAELGGTTSGMYFGVLTNGTLVFRFAGNGTGTGTSYLMVPVSSLPTGSATYVFDYNVTTKAVRAWRNGVRLAGTENFQGAGNWAGTDGGGVYQVNTTTNGANAAAWSGTIGSGLRAYYNKNVAAPAILTALSGTFTAPENAAPGTVAGVLQNRQPGSTLTLRDDAGGRVTVDSATAEIRIGTTPLDYEAAASHGFDVTETSGTAVRHTPLTLQVTDVAEADTSAPTFQNATVDGAALTANFSEPLDAASVPAASAFPLTVNGQGVVPLSAGVSGVAVTLTLANAVSPGATVVLGYTQPGTNRLRDAAGNNVATFSGRAVDNITTPDDVAKLSPNASFTGPALSGFASGSPIPPPTPRTTIPQPALLPLFAPDKRFTTSHRVYFDTAAIEADGSILNTVGVNRVEFHYEGNVATVTEPADLSYVDENGVSKTLIDVWACDLINNGTHGKAGLYVVAYPRNPAFQPRRMGPYYFYPAATALDGTIDVGPNQTYKTIDAAVNFAASQVPAWHTAKIRIVEPGEYNPSCSGGPFNNDGRLIIEATVPGVSFGQSMLPGAGTFTFTPGTITSAWRPNAAAFTMHYNRIELRKITVDFRYMFPFNVPDIEFNTCLITRSGGRLEYWGGSEPQLSKIANFTSWLRDCRTLYAQNPAKQAESAVHCAFDEGQQDQMSGCKLILHTTTNIWGKDIHALLRAAIDIRCASGNGTLAKSGSVFTFKEGATTVATYTAINGPDAFMDNTSTATSGSRVSHLANFINTNAALANWDAVTLDDSIRLQHVSGLLKPGIGGGSTTFSATAVGVAYTRFATHDPMHADYRSQASMDVNSITRNNVNRGLRGMILYWLGGNPPLDHYHYNNVYEGDLYINTPFQQIATQPDGLFFAHNTYVHQENRLLNGANLGSGLAKWNVYGNNATPGVQFGTNITAAQIGHFVGNHSHTLTYKEPEIAAAGYTLTTGGTPDSVYANWAAGNFEPKPLGELATNKKARLVRRDLFGNERAASDAAGAIRIPVAA